MRKEESIITKNRKTRSDKKKDVKPTVSVNLKRCIERLSFITGIPIKDVVEIICEKGLRSKSVIDHLSEHFRRDFQYRNTLYLGDLEKESLQRKRQSGRTERITTRFTQLTYENICTLAYALDVTPTKATGILLDASVRNTNILNAFVKSYLHTQLDQNRMKELKQILKFINQNNPYQEEISWFALVSKIFDDIKASTHNVKIAINHWMDKQK
ncbi:hypothetical protein MOF23_22520 [Bacillus inaquosorum]|uniref:hypothetical protein n=1 Tax=Bacillus subtilis group TaxID=653685 RepID=UPI002282D4BC|nr:MULTISPECIES: hypothetical protein [Bacillus subtilis group]MCY9311710.1 hypothetical protein [Bacillus inaquosorum]WJE41229.1 hypothetical protein QRD86_00300 [Bacillus halotolerans]